MILRPEAFSKLLRLAIEEAEKLFEHPLKQYMLFREFEEQVQDRRLKEIPDVFAGNHHAQAYFGVYKKYCRRFCRYRFSSYR